MTETKSVGRPKRGESRAENRPERIPVTGKRLKLSVQGKDPAYHYVWLNDDDSGKIQQYLEGGYEFVKHGEVTIGERRVDHSNDSAGENVSRNVGKGVTAFLLKIRKEWKEEDVKIRHDEIDKAEEALRRELNSGKNNTYGEVKFS